MFSLYLQRILKDRDPGIRIVVDNAKSHGHGSVVVVKTLPQLTPASLKTQRGRTSSRQLQRRHPRLKSPPLRRECPGPTKALSSRNAFAKPLLSLQQHQQQQQLRSTTLIRRQLPTRTASGPVISGPSFASMLPFIDGNSAVDKRSCGTELLGNVTSIAPKTTKSPLLRASSFDTIYMASRALEDLRLSEEDSGMRHFYQSTPRMTAVKH